MIRSASLVALSLWTAIGAVAQEPQATRDPATEAWFAFRAQHGPTWTAVWNKATATPKAIFGEGLRVADGVRTVDQARGLARAVLDEHAVLLGRGDSTFVETIGRKVGRVFVFVYDQRYAGLEVVGGRADVRLHDNGVVSMFGSKAVSIPAGFATRAAVSGEAAWTIAHDDRGVQPPVGDAPNADLVVHADVEGAAPATPRLAWRVSVDVRNGENLTVGKVFVDAHTGEAFQFVDEVYHCAFGHVHVRGEDAEPPSGHVGRAIVRAKAAAGSAPVDITGNVRAWLNRGDPLTPLTNEPVQGLRVTATGVGSAFTDANGDFTIPYAGTAPVTLTVNFGSGSGQYIGGGVQPLQGTAVTGSVQATPGVPAQIQLLTPTSSHFDWSQPTVFWHVDDVYRWVRSLTGSIPGNLANIRATVNRASTCNAYYTNNSINFYASGGGCNMTGYSSVVYHEWGHGLDDVFGGISQTDGLSEGWGDIISIYRLDDPIVGRNFTTSGGFVRDANNTYQYPAGGGVHQQGQTWMGFAWDLRNNLIASLGRSAGIAQAEAIVVASIAADATNQPDAVREVFILDDDDGNLANGTPHYADLEAAAIGRNLPYPRIQIGTIAHTPLQSTQDQLEPQLVQAIVTPILGSFTRIEVVYDIGTGAQRRDMVPTGTANEFVALIPGILSPASVSYHLEASHSSGNTLREPVSGELTYSIGDEQVFFFDDFEGGNLGWTHGLVLRQDDWQFGTPTGRTGSSSGVSWRDPSAAASGANAWGNDFGIGNYNGEYQPNVHNWLRSPVLDLTGRTGVKLAFKRWLTVEEGIYDQASILVNGGQVWQNPANGHLLDTSWVDFEVAIPAANNNPSVQLEWRLVTDAGLNLGGWAVDDVKLFSFNALPPPAVVSTLSPAQIPLGATSLLQIQGSANAPAAVLLSDSQGPLNVPGLPELYVGASFVALPIALDGSGGFSASLTATSDPSARGVILYGQTIEFVGGVFNTSNKMVMLFGN